jgi:D-glycero-D-manno-heptose 1,7-bisphosphate phosphatase
MLSQVASEMGIDLSQSYLVGDATTDLLAGERVGCQLFLVLTGRGRGQLVPSLRSVDRFGISRDLLEAANHILRTEVNLPHSDLAAVQPVITISFQAERHTVLKSTQGGQV